MNIARELALCPEVYLILSQIMLDGNPNIQHSPGQRGSPLEDHMVEIHGDVNIDEHDYSANEYDFAGVNDSSQCEVNNAVDIYDDNGEKLQLQSDVLNYFNDCQRSRSQKEIAPEVNYLNSDD